MNNRKKLLEFLKSQKFIVIGTQGDDPWIVNVFYGTDDDFNIYFVSGLEEIHSRHIMENPKVTFSTVWFNENDHSDRKGVQGRGICTVAKNNEKIEEGVRLHNINFPAFKEKITLEYVQSDDNKSKIWIIKPVVIKFWSDELYGDDEWEEFSF